MRLRDDSPPELDNPVLVAGSLAGAHFTWDQGKEKGKGMWLVRADLKDDPKVKRWMESQPPGTSFQSYTASEFESIAKEAIYQ